MFLLLLLFCCSYVAKRENGKKNGKRKEKGKTFCNNERAVLVGLIFFFSHL
jgi:hypothetical protein